jgi:hypothetical protein
VVANEVAVAKSIAISEKRNREAIKAFMLSEIGEFFRVFS